MSLSSASKELQHLIDSKSSNAPSIASALQQSKVKLSRPELPLVLIALSQLLLLQNNLLVLRDPNPKDSNVQLARESPANRLLIP
jgi:hypothetical protein